MEYPGSAFVAAQAEERRMAQVARRSYMPSWMADPSWLKSIEVPREYMTGLSFEELRESVRLTFASRLSVIQKAAREGTTPVLAESARRTMSSWAENDRKNEIASSQSSLMSLLADAIKAVTQRTPWDPVDCGTEMRKEMLAVLLKRFLDRSLDPGAVGIFAKNVLRRASTTDVAEELQYLYVAFTHDKTWNGEDPYRRLENFIHFADNEKFQEHCLEEVRRRLHMLNVELNGKNNKEMHAKKVWEDIHGPQRGECFGGSITLSLTRVHLSGISGSDASKNVGGAKKNLPKRIKAIWTLQQESHRVASAVVPGKSTLKNGTYTWQPNSRATLMVPKGAREHFRNYAIVLELFLSQTSCLCSPSRGKPLASATITVDDALYASVARPNSPLRTSAASSLNDAPSKGGGCENEPFSDWNVGIRGYHFSSVLLSQATTSHKNEYPYSIESATTLCSMCCLNNDHNARPPPINLEEEENVTVPKVGSGKIFQDAWSKDHHNMFLRLVDILGDIDDMGVAIIKAYCRRYLIHGELETVALLSAVCTHSNLADRNSRDLCTNSVALLVKYRGNMTTHVTKQLVKESLDATYSNVIDTLLSLEEMSSGSLTSSSAFNPHEAGRVVEELKNILLLIDKDMKINDVILQEAQRDTKPLVEALEKLDGRVLREHRRGVVRETATDLFLPDLEKREDAAQLTGKAHCLYTLITDVTERCKRAFSFAKMSGSSSVMAVTMCRIESIVNAMSVPLRNVVTRILACLIRAPEPDPLGDTLGFLVSTYGLVMDLVGVLDPEDGTASICRTLASCFTDFLSSWFPLCESHISAWMSSIVTNEALEPLMRNTVHFNHSPGLFQDLLQALFAVFLRVFAWSEPRQHEMYAVHFFRLVQTLGEAFVDAVVARGRTSSQLEEWLVCLSNLNRYQKMVREFGEKDVTQQLIPVLCDTENLMEHQRRVIAEQARASTMETKEEFERHIGRALEQSVLSFLSDLTDARTLEKMPVTPSVMKDSAHRFKIYVGMQFRTAKNNLDDELFVEFLNEVVVRSYYGAFHSLALREGKRPLPETHVAYLLHLMQVLDQEIELLGGNLLHTEPLTSRQRSGRILTALLGQSSQVLVQMAKTERLDRTERVQVMLLLRSRTDGIAKQYFTMSSDK
ncbi:hypothetical protein ECC02_005902 [Trypanosoma cruzi]|uniref:Uncharacterized protein n=1 Tax=Trypanosoma cruzi TaxID=5693 RepID=A0A7J6Y3Q2_TRYCR|nr:hypothetical protein ECC02_005902 [Trypanosoma cruzi]